MQRPYLIPAGRALTLLRLLLGGILLSAAVGKLSWDKFPGISEGWLLDFASRMNGWVTAHQSGVGVAVVRDLVLPHSSLFATLLALCQLLLGALLLAGAFTRMAALLAALLSTTLALMASISGGSRFYLLLALLALALALGDAGQTWGYDAVRRQRRL